mmetsp:Transcript_3978/g.14788  ORF Transcript_3978/g.14788 Transcript_3978/m.14788 type:complete len:223 (+) Transcript_3978:996-1664(+)
MDTSAPPAAAEAAFLIAPATPALKSPLPMPPIDSVNSTPSSSTPLAPIAPHDTVSAGHLPDASRSKQVMSGSDVHVPDVPPTQESQATKMEAPPLPAAADDCSSHSRPWKPSAQTHTSGSAVNTTPLTHSAGAPAEPAPAPELLDAPGPDSTGALLPLPDVSSGTTSTASVPAGTSHTRLLNSVHRTTSTSPAEHGPRHAAHVRSSAAVAGDDSKVPSEHVE